MKGLTVKQPWAYAIARLGKDIENRTWPPTSVIGQQIAIHAGKSWDGAGSWYLASRRFTLPDRDEIPLGAVVAVATVRDVVTCDDKRAKRRVWYRGPVGWVLADVIALPEPVPCRGALGLWTLPRRVCSAVLAQI